MTRGIWCRLFVLSAALFLAGCAATAAQPGVVPVSPFDVQRYQGQWYEIARLDSWFERGLSEVTARYTVQPDGSLQVLNRGFDAASGAWREAEGRALLVAGPNTASLKVSFFRPFYGGYHVVTLDPVYQWALVVGDDLSYCWILARTPQLAEDVRGRLV